VTQSRQERLHRLPLFIFAVDTSLCREEPSCAETLLAVASANESIDVYSSYYRIPSYTSPYAHTHESSVCTSYRVENFLCAKIPVSFQAIKTSFLMWIDII
jgi:hypothetical protein